jgi:hypothetical protein
MHLSGRNTKLRIRNLLQVSIILGFLSATVLQAASGENYIEAFQHGRIDWTNGFIEAFGVGRPPVIPLNAAHARAVAESNANIVARNNLIALVKSIRVDSETMVADYWKDRGIPDEILTTLLRDARTVDLSYGADEAVRVKASIRLQGSLSEGLLPKDILVITTVQQPHDPGQKEEPFSGLLVDCKGFSLQPCLVPRIVDEDGEVIYGPAFASRDHAVERGMASYVRGPVSGDDDPRVGPKPLSVKGIRVMHGRPCDIMISHADAAKIRRTASNLNFLHQCRVLLVTD